MRRNQFTVDAESVQGNADATVVFKALKVREVREYIADPAQNDTTLLQSHILSWSGIVDDDNHEMPSPADEPDIVGELYVHERLGIVELLFQGPDGPQAKN